MGSFTKWNEEPFETYGLKGYRKFLHKLSCLLPNGFLTFKLALVLRKLTLQNKLEIVDAESIENLFVRLYPLDNIGDRLALFMPWYFERLEFKIVRRLLKEGQTFLDIGANTGYYSLLASKFVGEDGRVLAFEPNPTMFQRLKYNLMINKSANVLAFNVGLADKTDEFTLHLNPNNLGSATIMHDFHAGSDYRISISCRPLLEILVENNLEKIDFMKIDVEGAEPLILNTFFETADKLLWPTYILTETTEGIPFEALGYLMIEKTKNNTLFKLGGPA